MATPTDSMAPDQLHAEMQLLLNGPAGSPPAGVLPHVQDPSNLDTYLIVTLTLCIALATVTFCLRMYTKRFLIRSIAYEDYVITIAWIGQVAETIPSGFCTRHGGGSHMWNIPLKEFFQMLYWVNISAIVYCPVVFLVKLSILLQYLRIFVPIRQGNTSMFIAIHVCIWSCFVLYVVDMSFEIAMCRPREKTWNPFLPGHCFNNNASFLATGIFNVVSDFAILILPMPALWGLHAPVRKKIMMVAVFATGFLACITSILRTYYSWKVYKQEDVSYNMIIMGFWTYAEIAIAITVSCLPVLPKFFQHFGPRVQENLSSRFKLGIKSRGSGTSSKMRFLRAFAKQSGDSEPSDSWKGPGVNGALHKGEYITLGDRERPPPVPSKSLVAEEV